MEKKEKIKLSIISLMGAVVLIVLDQWTKFLAVDKLKDGQPFAIIEGVFELSYLENFGSAFGMFQGKSVGILIVTVFILAAGLWVFQKFPWDNRKFRILKLDLVLLFAGAVGNMIDRFLNGYVVDFFYFKLINFPVFNVADIYVVVATFALAFLILFYYKEEDFEEIFPSKSKSSKQ